MCPTFPRQFNVKKCHAACGCYALLELFVPFQKGSWVVSQPLHLAAAQLYHVVVGLFISFKTVAVAMRYDVVGMM